MLPSKKIMVRTALRSSKQNWWPRRVRTRRQSWVGKLNPISKFKWPPQKSFPTLSLAEITCEPCQSALYSLGVADFVWGSWRIGEGQDWGDWSWQEAAGGVVGFGRPKIQASNSWKDGFLEEGLQIIDAMLQWSFYVKIKKTIQDTLGLPNGLFLCAPTSFLRTRVVFEITFPCFHTSHYCVTSYQLCRVRRRSEDLKKSRRPRKSRRHPQI